MAQSIEENIPPAGAQYFATTHWSVVLAAAGSDAGQRSEALEKLCRVYWFPIYTFIRRSGHNQEEAEDLTQEFFARLLEKNYLQHLTHRNGKFRSFLLKFVQHFLSDERDKLRAKKRGGGRWLFSLDSLSPEERYRLEPIDDASPERAFERCWVRTLVQQTLVRLRDEYVAHEKGELFECLKDYQPGERDGLTCAQLGERLGMTEAAVKVAIHRLRRRHRDLLREQIAETVSSPSELEEEVRHLIALMGT